MMINPMQIMKAIQTSADPNRMLMQMAQQNPALQQAMQMVNGRTPDQIRDMAYGMAKQRGVDLNKLAQQMGIQLPK